MRIGAGGMGRMLGRVVFAALFLAGGVGHFVAPDVYLRIMPPYLPAPRALVLISGAAEMVLGALLLPRGTRRGAAWGLIALLIAIFPANVFMWQHADRFGIPAWPLLLRLPLQGLLIAWAWAYTRPDSKLATARPNPIGAAPPLLVGLAILMGLAGCGFGGRSLGRLAKGTAARTQSEDGRPIVVYFAASEETLPAGTVVKVVDDAEGSIDQLDRKVLVGFADGPHQGLAAFVRRRDLEPDR